MLKIVLSISDDKRQEYLVEGLSPAACSGLRTQVLCAPAVIVPEQFLFETERSLYRLLGARRISDIDITGFTKLSASIVKQYGGGKLYADDIVKTVTMYKVLNQLKPALTYYKGFAFTVDFAQRMLNAVAQFKSAGITMSKLRSAVTGSGLSETLQDKLSDLTEIYCAYCETLDTLYADKLDDCKTAADLISRHDCFKGSSVFVYEFDNLSGSQLNLLNAIANSADNVTVLLRSDRQAEVHSKLINPAPAKAMQSLIKRLQRDNDYEVIDIGGQANTPVTEYWAADDVYDECRFVAEKIYELVTEHDYFYNDIAVLTCNTGTMTILKQEFAEFDISAFMDIPEPIIKKPMIRFIVSALESLTLDTNKLLMYIRSGFVRVPAILERYDMPRNLRIAPSTQHGFVGACRCPL
jgi:ATP-dependent helicase/nuclease subunit B